MRSLALPARVLGGQRLRGDTAAYVPEPRPGGAGASAWRADGADLLSLTLIMIAATVAVESTDDLPLIDDWVYAWSVDHFLKTGQLRVLDW
ncbi:MAG: hypothetical protein DMD83_22775, partial [Candidatus Rokuibacteriota bacterium]